MMFSFKQYFLLCALSLLGLGACVDTQFDEPPVGGEPVDLTSNISIKTVKDSIRRITGNGGKGFYKFVGNATFKGMVVMNDRSGNYYKTLVIQDSTGGIEVLFNDGFLYNQFPIGRQLAINCKGLILTNTNDDKIQLTGDTVQVNVGDARGVGITDLQIRQSFTLSNVSERAPSPRVITMSDLRNPIYLGTLVQLNDVQFASLDLSKTFAEPITNADENRALEDCRGLKTIVRTSGYADFAGAKLPQGKGSLVGILGAFRNDSQIFIRDLDDVKMTGERCSGGGGGGGGGPLPAPVATINEAFNGVANNTDFKMEGWTNIGTKGSRVWRGSTFQAEKFVSATAFGSNLAEMETWLITPPVDLKTQKNLSLITSWQVWKHDGLTVWVSNNFNGSNATTATWTKLDVKVAKQTDAQFAWIPSGDVKLPIYATGFGVIGFKYEGNSAANTTTWRIDDVVVK